MSTDEHFASLRISIYKNIRTKHKFIANQFYKNITDRLYPPKQTCR